jgi:outer membrane biosynthesis protein TonB
MKLKNKIKLLSQNQQGIGVMAVLAVIFSVTLIGVAGVSVYSYQANIREENRLAEEKAQQEQQASKLKTEEQVEEVIKVPASEEEKETVEKPTEEPAPAPKPAPVTEPKKTTTPEKNITKFDIKNTAARVNIDNVVIGADLGSSRSGTCEVLVKWPDGSNAQTHKVKIASQSSCSVTIPISKLSSNTNWQFYVFYANDEHTVKGYSGKNTFEVY